MQQGFRVFKEADPAGEEFLEITMRGMLHHRHV
jgi:hypothetical protein